MPLDPYIIRLPLLSPEVNLRALTPWHQVAEDSPMAGLPPGLIPVQYDSPVRLRRAVHKLACCYQREIHCDTVQWSEDDEEPSTMAFLWCPRPHEHAPAIGAVCFRAREWKDAPAGYGLAWAWFHPYERRVKHLTRAWPFFRSMFGDFVVEPPRSLAMEAFLAKQASSVSENL